MKKKFLLDTNVLMHSPKSVFVFEDNDVYICHKTLEELDRNKGAVGEQGYNARNAIRTLYNLRALGDLTKGVKLSGGGELKIVEDVTVTNSTGPITCNDDVIIETAKKNNAILVTNDIGMIMKADVRGVRSETFRNEEVSEEALKYTGREVVAVEDVIIDILYQLKEIPSCDVAAELTVNQFLTLKGNMDEKKSALAYYDGQNIKLLKKDEISIPNSFEPKNSGQKFMIKALTSPVDEIPLAIIRGAAGTGKTLAALAAGLAGVEKGLYNKVLLLRPNVKFEDDIGFLPGTEFEKIMPLLRPYMDNLEVLLTKKESGKKKENREKSEPTKAIEEMFNKGILQAESLAYIRGRSIAHTYVIVDETQNATPLQAKSIISRIGMGSKIVLLGDPDQIDTPKVNKLTNGLVYAADRMRGSSLCMQVVMEDEECVRCPLALEAVKRL